MLLNLDEPKIVYPFWSATKLEFSDSKKNLDSLTITIFEIGSSIVTSYKI